MIKITIGFEKITDDKEIEFIFDSDNKTAIEKAIVNFLTNSGEADGWSFANWKSASKSGTVFNTSKNL